MKPAAHLRWRLTLAFALALTAVLGAAGVYLYAQLRADMDVATERDLRMRADQLSGRLIRSPATALTRHAPGSGPGREDRPEFSPPRRGGSGQLVRSRQAADTRQLNVAA